jgi:hypothetical protein
LSQVVTTGGGLALISRADGTINAFDDKTGAPAWTLQTGSSSIPRFSFYGANGKEYLVATVIGSDNTPKLNAYSLG